MDKKVKDLVKLEDECYQNFRDTQGVNDEWNMNWQIGVLLVRRLLKKEYIDEFEELKSDGLTI